MNALSYRVFARFRKNMQFVLIGFLVVVVLACQSTPSPKTAPSSAPDAIPGASENSGPGHVAINGGPPLQTATLRQDPPPDALKQLIWGGLGGGGREGRSCGSKSGKPMFAYYGEQDFLSGEIAHITALHAVEYYNDLDTSKLPTICVNSLDLVNAATATSPAGLRLRPSAELPTDKDLGSVYLPLEALGQPGLWHLVIDTSGQHFDLGVEVPLPKVPTHVQVGTQVLLAGFDSGERIVGVTLSGKGAIDLQVDSRGYGLIISPFPDYESTFAFVGENGHVSCDWCDPETSTILYDYYWHGGSGKTVEQATLSACTGILPSHLWVGQQARVAFTDGAPLRIHIAPSESAEVGDRIPEGTFVDIVAGPVCADGWVWWKIRTNDGFVGWAAEGDSQAGYWLEP